MSKSHQAPEPEQLQEPQGRTEEQSQVESIFGNSFLSNLVPGVEELLPDVLRGGELFSGNWFGEDERGGDQRNPRVEVLEHTDFSNTAQTMFPDLDSDGDGYLSAENIDVAMNDPDLTPQQAATVATLRRLRDELEELSNDEYFDEDSGITMADLRAYERTGQVPQELRRRVEGAYSHGLGRINGASNQLFTNADGNVDVDAIRQGALGDCQFLAAVGSLVAQDPGAVNDMISPNSNGTYSVTFPGHAAVTVNAPTNAEIAAFSTSGSDGMWLTLLERAYGQLQDPDALIPQDALRGSGSSDAIVDLSGGTGVNRDDTLWTSQDTIRERMGEAFDNDRIVTVGLDDDTEGLPGGHRYSVVGYDAANDTVTIRNPWGDTEHEDSTDGVDDGTFTMSISEFNRVFDRIYYQQGG